MKTRQKTTILGVVLLVLLAIIGSLYLFPQQAAQLPNTPQSNTNQTTSTSPNSPISLRLVSAPQPGSTNSTYTFQVMNNGRSTFVCPDSWAIESTNGTVTDLSLLNDMRVDPGMTGSIRLPITPPPGKWRVVCSYYLEDIAFDAKIAAAQSPLKNHLPAGSTAIQGKVVYSEWME